jgi:uncharacterized membrane protein
MTEINPHSTAKLGGHPLHPMIVPFPIAFFVGALGTDILYLAMGRPGFAEASIWLIGAGLAGAALAAVLGLTDFLGDRLVRGLRQAWLHMALNVSVVVLEIVNIAFRAGRGVETGIMPIGLIMSIVAALLLVASGWLGGEMVYRRHVGVLEPREARVRER